MDLIRGVAGDIIENVECVDKFYSKKENKESRSYKITYRCLERTLTNEEVDRVQFEIRDQMVAKLGLKLR